MRRIGNFYGAPRASWTLVFLILTVGSTLHGAEPNSSETRLRELLRNTMLQLRTAETERASLQSAQAENGKQKKELSDQVEELSKQLKSVKENADKAIADLEAKNSQQESDLAQLKEVLGKWKESQKQAVDLATAKETQRAKLAADNILLQRRVDDYRGKNLALSKVGNEILNRYEGFGLGDALTAREPFVGLTRVKLQNLIQDYQDKLTDQKIRP
jgi:chromosome segregation ATPase